MILLEKFFVEKNPTSLTRQWQEVGGGWSNIATIQIYESENDFNEYICTQSHCDSIWISIDATNSNRNNKGGEFEFHSIFNNAPAYRNVKKDYIAYTGSGWFIMPEHGFLAGANGGWFTTKTTGTLKNLNFLEKFF